MVEVKDRIIGNNYIVLDPIGSEKWGVYKGLILTFVFDDDTDCPLFHSDHITTRIEFDGKSNCIYFSWYSLGLLSTEEREK